jgi:GTP-binding nuclear protein Ran
MSKVSNVNTEVRLKVVLVGDIGVGKSTYVKRLVTGEFEFKYIPTVGSEVHPLDWVVKYAEEVETKKGKLVIDVWDTAGNEEMGGLTEAYYKGADGCICMFDVTNKMSFENLDGWIEKFRRVSNAPIYIVGNKVDVTHSEVTSNMFSKFLSSRGLKGWFISAKSNYNFEKVFIEIGKLKFGENMVLTTL